MGFNLLNSEENQLHQAIHDDNLLLFLTCINKNFDQLFVHETIHFIHDQKCFCSDAVYAIFNHDPLPKTILIYLLKLDYEKFNKIFTDITSFVTVNKNLVESHQASETIFPIKIFQQLQKIQTTVNALLIFNTSINIKINLAFFSHLEKIIATDQLLLPLMCIQNSQALFLIANLVCYRELYCWALSNHLNQFNRDIALLILHMLFPDFITYLEHPKVKQHYRLNYEKQRNTQEAPKDLAIKIYTNEHNQLLFNINAPKLNNLQQQIVIDLNPNRNLNNYCNGCTIL